MENDPSALLASSAEKSARGPAGATSGTSQAPAASSVVDPSPATATAPVRRVSAQDAPRKRRRPVLRDDSSEDEREAPVSREASDGRQRAGKAPARADPALGGAAATHDEAGTLADYGHLDP